MHTSNSVEHKPACQCMRHNRAHSSDDGAAPFNTRPALRASVDRGVFVVSLPVVFMSQAILAHTSVPFRVAVESFRPLKVTDKAFFFELHHPLQQFQNSELGKLRCTVTLR
jgi:hypothetical protein